MKIGIDCRMYGIKHAGIGRYVENLVEELLKQDKTNEYVLFVKKDFVFAGQAKLKIITVNIPHYSLKEQIVFPGIIEKEKLDLMHFPHFNVPFFYRGKYVVTIHDLIKHFSTGKETTTKNPLFYWIKYLGYKLVFNRAVNRADKIIVPSVFVKNEVIKEYSMNPDKIMVTYEGVDNKIKDQKSKIKTELQNKDLFEKYQIEKPYLLYVGSVYPHKNIERLIEAMKSLRSTDYRLQLVIVCARNVFLERLKEKIRLLKAEDFINLAGFVLDEDLAYLYKYSKAFIFPTMSEGFGLPGLEAMSVSCPVICSDIPVLREIYKDGALYFNPLDMQDISNKINTFLNDENIGKNLIVKAREIVNKYSWEKMAKETLEIYGQLKIK